MTEHGCGAAVDELLRAFVAAPSLHNTQPWRLRVKDDATRIEIFADPVRMLPVSDPQGRAAYIACGAGLLNLRIAAAANDLRADVVAAPDPGRPLLVAQVELSDGYRATPDDRELAAAIPRRHSNREPYNRDLIPAGIRHKLALAAMSEGGTLHVLDGDDAVRVRRLATDAERVLLADPAYRAELACWVSKGRREAGIPIEDLGPRSPVGRDPVRDFAPGRPEPVRYADFEQVPQMAVLSVRADGVPDWITAGQALERVWLTATGLGISLCPLTPPFETRDAWLVRDPRWRSECPQMIMRIGYGPQVRTHTPRRAVADVVDWS